MTHFSTPDLFDEYASQLQVAEAGLMHFGKQKHLSGQAITLQCPNDNSLVGETLLCNGKGKVLVVDAGNSSQYAFLGDQLAKRAIENQWQGIVINGCIRDVEILRALPITIMARGCSPRKTKKQGLGAHVEAVSFLSVAIKQHDWVYGDENGLLISPSQLLA